MDEKETKNINDKSQSSVEKIESEIYEKTEEIIIFCKEKKEDVNFFSFEKALKNKMCGLGCLFIQLFLMSIHNRLTYCNWLAMGKFYEKKELLPRTIIQFMEKSDIGENTCTKKKRVEVYFHWTWK